MSSNEVAWAQSHRPLVWKTTIYNIRGNTNTITLWVTNSTGVPDNILGVVTNWARTNKVK